MSFNFQKIFQKRWIVQKKLICTRESEMQLTDGKNKPLKKEFRVYKLKKDIDNNSDQTLCIKG